MNTFAGKSSRPPGGGFSGGGAGGNSRGAGGGGGNFRDRKPTGPRTNDRIRVPKVRVIDADGAQLGILLTRAALDKAFEMGLDLVEISPTADPPVCKIMDYGKFKYEQQKKEQASKKKQTVVSVKEIKLRPNTDKHDLEFKLNHVKKFLEHKDKAKITIQLRGREMMFKERAHEIMNEIVAKLKGIGEPEQPPKMEGRTLSVIISPCK